MSALPHYPTAVELAQAYRHGHTTPLAVAEQALAHCSRADPAIFITLTVDRALAEARASTQRYVQQTPLGLLDGVPLVWKDLFDVEGTITTAASALRRDAPVAVKDCNAVSRLRDCGMVCIGKVNLSEFAYSGLGLNSHFGTPANPHDALSARAPGGSSSGTAVAVARGLVPVGIGTDTGGSVRVPAAFNGLVGYKSSTGRIDKSGVFALSNSLDTVGPLAHSVQDCVALDAALRGVTDLTWPLVPLPSLHVVVPTNLVLDNLQPAVERHFETALQRLSDAGVTIERRPMPELDEIQRLTQAHGTLAAAEAYRIHRAWMESPEKARVDPRVVTRLERGKTMTALDLLEIQEARKLLALSVANCLGDALVLMPTVAHVAPLIEALDADVELFHRTNLLTLRNTLVGNFLDWCGIAMPMGLDPTGLPTSLLISAPWGRDDTLLRAALAIESLLPNPNSVD